MSQPLVTVIMPVRNCEKTVMAAMRSVLNQTFQDWEMLVVDDGSTDGTLTEVRRFQCARVRVLTDGHSKGLPTRLNECIKGASGEFVARMDGDDVCYPDRLELQVKYLRSHPAVDVIGGGVLVFDGDGRLLGKRIPPESHAAICRRPYNGFPIAHPTFCGKTGWFRYYGYSEAVLLSQDQEMLLRAYESSCYANVPAILLGYREQLKLDKLLRSRRFHTRSLLAHYLQRGRPITAGFCVLLQYSKGAVDLMALLSGLKYHILRHRARPVSNAEVAQWRSVWLAANRVFS